MQLMSHIIWTVFIYMRIYELFMTSTYYGSNVFFVAPPYRLLPPPPHAHREPPRTKVNMAPCLSPLLPLNREGPPGRTSFLIIKVMLKGDVGGG